MTLDISKKLYQELQEDLDNIDENRQDHLKSILCEYVSIKCAEEIKKDLQGKVYEYLANSRIFAKDILAVDGHKMPRDFKELSKSFSNAQFDVTGLEEMKLIVLIRHAGAHNSVSNVPYSWEQLSEIMSKAETFLNEFEHFLSEQRA